MESLGWTRAGQIEFSFFDSGADCTEPGRGRFNFLFLFFIFSDISVAVFSLKTICEQAVFLENNLSTDGFLCKPLTTERLQYEG